MALGLWALLLAGATGEGCVRLDVLWAFLGSTLGKVPRVQVWCVGRRLSLDRRELSMRAPSRYRRLVVRGVELRMVEQYRRRDL